MGTSKTQVEPDSSPTTGVPANEQVQPAPELNNGPVHINKTGSFLPPPNSQTSSGCMKCGHTSGAGRAQQSTMAQRQLGNAHLSHMLSGPQTKIPVGQPGDRYEQEADEVASRIVSGQKVARISRIALGGQALPVERQEEEEEEEAPVQAKPLKRQTEEEELLQGLPVQRQPPEEEELMQGMPVQRQLMEEEEEAVQAIPLKRQAEELPEQPGGEETWPESSDTEMQAAEGVQTKANADGGSEVEDSDVESRLRSPGGGRPLSEGVKTKMETSMGADFSAVRIHDNTQDQDDAKSLGAKAFAYKSDVWIGKGASEGDSKLMAHELTHVVQQGSAPRRAPTYQKTDIQPALSVARLQRQKDSTDTSPLKPDDLGAKIGEYGIAYKKEGVNLRDYPASNPNSKVIARLKFNTRMYVDSVLDDYYFVGTDDGRYGYVATTHVKTNLPEPDSKIYHIKEGDTALGISRKHFGGGAEWGSDHRFFVNGLVYVNRGTGNRGIYKPDPKADWDTTEVRAGYMIWVPSLKFMQSLQGVVKSGSITYEAWQTVKNVAIAIGEFLLGTGAFVVGLLHGALESVWDVFVGLKDLAVMAWDLVKWLFGLITGDSKGLFDSLKDVNWSELVQGWIDDFDAKWNHDSILKKWHFRGWVIGYAIAEVLMLFFSGGIIQGIKWVGKSAKVAKVISKIPKIAKLKEAAKTSKVGQKFSKALEATKGAKVAVNAWQEWAIKTLKFPVDSLVDLSAKAVQRLKSIPKWAQEAISKMGRAEKLDILGCHSPCKVFIRAIWRRLERVVEVRGVLVRGFRNAGELVERVGNLRNRLFRTGLDDAVIGLRGSSITGVSAKGGEFRWLRTAEAKASDVDFFFTSTKLERKLDSLGASFKPGGWMTLKELNRHAPDVVKVLSEFGDETLQQLGRKGSAFLLRKSTADALKAGEHIIF